MKGEGTKMILGNLFWSRYVCSVIAIFLFAGCSSVDHSARFKTLQQAASRGDVSAQFELAAAYDRGFGVPRDVAEAAKWYRKAAEQGHSESQNSLGSLYQSGEGVPKDNAEAVKWYRKAAEQGLPIAKNNIAYMYDLGLGVPKDNQLAAKLYGEAAELGEVRAMLNLGVLYVQGQGVEKNHVEAYKWLDLARFYSQRSEDMQLKWRSRGALDELTKMMTPSQIEEGKKRSQDWDKAHRSK